ncbi:hypothetical protein ACFQY7_15775 [Actinomadura luteofluorescens]|uniref:DUF7134 domain-containing protein n=1 Tax=Actinomadura luteofluorescens TaxID=46163 RepID=UPI003644E529
MDESELRSPLPRLSRRGLIGLDAGAALLYALVLLALPAGTGASPLLAVPLGAAAALPLAVRRLWPVPVFAAVLSASTAALLLDLPWDTYASAGFALYQVALTRRRRRWVPTLLIGVVSAVFIFAAPSSAPSERRPRSSDGSCSAPPSSARPGRSAASSANAAPTPRTTPAASPTRPSPASGSASPASSTTSSRTA